MPDVAQPLLDTPTVTLDGQHSVGQTFRTRFAQLSAIEVRLVVYGGDDARSRLLTFHLRTSPRSTIDLVTVTYDASALRHNDVVRFNFAPQPNSAGAAYYMLIEGVPSAPLALWSSSVSNYDPGTLFSDAQPKAGDLTFATFYDYNLAYLSADVGDAIWNYGWLILPLAFALLLPGLIVVGGLAPLHSFNLIELTGLSIVSSLVVFPILFLWLPAVGVYLSPFVLWIILAVLAVSGLLGLGLRYRAGKRVAISRIDGQSLIGFSVVFALILVLRLVNLKGLELPLWVDSVHHSAITRLIAEQGAIPSSYRPYADVDRVYYHFGFHVASVVLAWLSGLDVERAMLVMGQILNSLSCASLYILTARWTGRSLAGLAAMIVAGTISLMPAYYVTWGRYTQLDGLVILPIAIIIIQEALEHRSRRMITLAALLVAGLFLVHYRVTLFLATFVLAYLLWQTFSRIRHRQSLLELWSRALAIGVIAALVTLPWWLRLLTVLLPLDTLAVRMASSEDYNAVPWNLVSTGHNPSLLVLAGLGIVLTVWRDQERRSRVIMILLWIILTVLLVNPSLLGVQPTWIINNFSTVIALFVPLSILVGFCVASLWQILERRIPGQRLSGVNAVAFIALMLIAIWTAPDMVNIVNPITNLVTDDDLAALHWIHDFVPPNAIFLVNERRWQGETYVGTDAGYWIPQLTGRRTTMPIALYSSGSPAYAETVNKLARLIEAEPDPDSPAFLDTLRDYGVTHVYIGAKGGPLPLLKLLSSPHYQPIFTHGAARVFAVRY